MQNRNLLSLPDACTLRKATSGDIWSIRYLVFSAKLDPTQIYWQQFWVIECDGKIVACGQLRNFPNAQELGSLVVASAWRGRGFGEFSHSAFDFLCYPAIIFRMFGSAIGKVLPPLWFCTHWFPGITAIASKQVSVV